VTILLDNTARWAMQAHALRCRDREVAGFLVALPPEKQPDGFYVVGVMDYIEAQFTVSRSGTVQLTPDSWHHVHTEVARRHPGRPACLAGWAHTHPGFGIFLSESDLFIHRHFFTQCWQVAAVLDPIGRSGGFFAWNPARTEIPRHEFAWHWGD
jgi:proteasome lid subunit RPN8/RPN11